MIDSAKTTLPFLKKNIFSLHSDFKEYKRANSPKSPNSINYADVQEHILHCFYSVIDVKIITTRVQCCTHLCASSK